MVLFKKKGEVTLPFSDYYLIAADELTQHTGGVSIFSMLTPLSNTIISSLSIVPSFISGYHLPMQNLYDQRINIDIRYRSLLPTCKILQVIYKHVTYYYVLTATCQILQVRCAGNSYKL